MAFTYDFYSVKEWFDENFEPNGSNQSQVLFVYASDDKDHLGFLSKVISAVNLDMERSLSCAIDNDGYMKIPSTWEGRNISVILAFGLLPKQLCHNYSCNAYEVQQYNGVKVLYAEGLSHIKDSKESKKKLWICLKELFGV